MDKLGQLPKFLLFSCIVLLTAFSLAVKPVSAAASTVTYLDSDSMKNDADAAACSSSWGDWKGNYDGDFVEINGKTVTRGIGFRDNDSGYAAYGIAEMGYTTFDADLSLDKNWSLGGRGKTAIGIYADDHQLYEKQLSVKSGVVKVHLDIPANTQYIRFKVKQISGQNGEHRVILANARLSTGGKSVVLGDEKSLDSYEFPISNDGEFQDEWSDYDNFQDINGNLVTSGIGLHSDWNISDEAKFNISNLGYNLFETKVSLDKEWTVGDYGKTVVAVYADDYKLYEKQLTARTPVQSLKLRIPKGTKTLKLVAVHLKGTKDTQQGVVFDNPVLKKVNSPAFVVPQTVSTTSLLYMGLFPGDCYIDNWGGDGPFQYSNGDLAAYGLGFKTFQDFPGSQTFNITNLGFNQFSAKLSLDPKWVRGDYGKSSIYFYINKKLVYSQAVTKATGTKEIKISIPSNATSFKIAFKQTKGTTDYQGIVLGDAQFQAVHYTPKLQASQVKVVNNTGKSDVVTVSKIKKGDVVTVYNTTGKLIAFSAPVKGSSVSLAISQIGVKSGKLYVSVQRGNLIESSRTTVSFAGERTGSLKANQVKITNNKGKSDTIVTTHLQKNEVVRVYNAKGVKLATSKPAASSSLTVYLKQLGRTAGNVYVTVTESGMRESAKVKINYKGE